MTYNLTRGKIAIISNNTQKVSDTTRRKTLHKRDPAIITLTYKLSRMCPPRGGGLFRGVVSGNNAVVSRCPPKAPPLKERFPTEGEVVTKVDQNVLIMRTTRQDNTLVASSFTLRRKQSIFSIPKGV